MGSQVNPGKKSLQWAAPHCHRPEFGVALGMWGLRTALAGWILGSGLIVWESEHGYAFQERISDQVLVTVVDDRLLGITPGEGVIRVPLAAGEQVLETGARGLNGFALTSSRLLAFSGPVQRWVEQRIDSSEKILAWRVTPRLIFVQSQRRVYGFQGPLARWKVQGIGAGENSERIVVKDHVIVVITDRRVMGLSALAGGFSTRDLAGDARLSNVEANDNIVVLTFSDRRLLFRAGLGIWVTLR